MKNPTLLGLILALSPNLHAADQTWIDANLNNNWNTDTDLNWDAGVAWAQGNNAIFGGTGETVTLATGISVGDMTFNAAGYQISGNTLTLANATNTITTNADVTIASVMSSTGARALVKEGTGTLTLTGVNPLGGTNEGSDNLFTVNSGTVKIAAGAKIGSTLNTGNSKVFVNTGGTLEITEYAFGGSFGNMNFNDGNLNFDGGTLKYSGADNVGETNNARGYTIGAGGMTFASEASGGGTWRIPGVTINKESAATVSFSGSGNGRFDTGLSGTGGITKSGTGTWTLTAAQGYSGATTVNQGKLILAYGNNSGQALATESTITIDNGGTLETTGINNINSNVFSVNAGGSLAMGAGKTSWIQGSLTLNGGTLASADGGLGGATFVLNPSSNQVSVTGDDTSTISAQNVLMAPNTSLTFDVADGASAIDLNVTGTLGNNGTSGLTKSGAGTMVLAGGNTYTGDTTVNAGALAVNGSSISNTNKLVINGGTVVLTGEETVGTLFFGLVQQAAGTYSANGTQLTGSGTLVVMTGPASGYASWMAPFITGGLTGDTTPGGDPENDGMTNLLEYALNGNPSISDPSIQPDPVVTATDFEFTYSRLDLSLADTTQTFEYGSNLTGWTPVLIPAGPGVEIPVGAAKVTIINTGTTDSVTIRIPKSVDPGGKLFGRLKVVK